MKCTNKTVWLLQKFRNISPMFYSTPFRLWLYHIWSVLQNIFLSKIRIKVIQCCFNFYQCNEENFKINTVRKAISRISSTKSLIQKNPWFFNNIFNKQILCSLTRSIPASNKVYYTRGIINAPFIPLKDKFFKFAFFPSIIIEWKTFDPAIWNSASYNIFKENILRFTRHASNKIY